MYKYRLLFLVLFTIISRRLRRYAMMWEVAADCREFPRSMSESRTGRKIQYGCGYDGYTIQFPHNSVTTMICMVAGNTFLEKVLPAINME